MNYFKNTLIFFLTQFILLNTSGQEITEKSKWSFHVFISPNLAYRFASNSNGLYPNDNNHSTSYVTDDQVPKFGFHLGIITNYKAKTNLSLQTGFRLNYNGYNTRMFNDTMWILNSGGYHGYNVYSKEIKYSNLSLGIPLLMNWEISHRKNIFFVIGHGLVINFIMWGKTSRAGYGKPEFKPSLDFRDLNINLIVKAGINYKLSDRFSLTILPVFNLNLIPNYDIHARDGATKNLNLYSAGIELGFSYHFKCKGKNK